LPNSAGYGGETAGTFKAVLKGVGAADDGRVVALAATRERHFRTPAAHSGVLHSLVTDIAI
jgi:hypothetical protein